MLATLLLLATALTFAVLVVFWQRSLVQLHADRLSGIVHVQGAGSAEEELARLLGEVLHEGDCAVQYVENQPARLLFGTTAACRSLLKAAPLATEERRQVVGHQWLGLLPVGREVQLVVPVVDRTGTPAPVRLQSGLGPVYAPVQQVLPYLLTLALVNVLVLTIIGFLRLYHLLFRPLEQMVTMAGAYSDRYGVPFLPLHSGGELDQLEESVTQMLDRVKKDRQELEAQLKRLETANQELVDTRAQMIRAEKLASVGRLASGLAHEIGNPVGIVQGYVGLLQQTDVSADERADFLARMQQELDRIGGLLRELLDFARVRAGQQTPLSLGEVVRAAISLLAPQPVMRAIDIDMHLESGPDLVIGDAEQLRQVLLNVLLNAADAIQDMYPQGGGRIVIHSSRMDGQEPARLLLQIRDNGPGIDDEDLDNLFDPFFTTKEPGRGTGLGLSISLSMLESMGGDLAIANHRDGGAEVSITLQCAPSSAPAASNASASTLAATR